MSRRAFDRIMVATSIGRSRKLRAFFTPAERWVFVAGVLCIAGDAEPRGCLLVAGKPATTSAIADEAGVPVAVAASALRKMRELDMLYEDIDLDCERVHDWDDYNPAPKIDRTNATRQRRHRERRNAVSNGDRNGARNGGITPTEVKKVEEVTPAALPEGASHPVERVFAEWRESTGHHRAVLDAKRRRLILAALRQYPEQDVIDAVRGWRHSPHHRGENDRHTVYNGLHVLLRDAEQIEKFRDLERGGRDGAPSGRDVVAALTGSAA